MINNQIINTKMIKKASLSLGVLLLSVPVLGQGTIKIEHKTKQYLKTETTLNKSKYFNIHNLTSLTDTEFINFKSTYGIASSYRGGRTFDSPMKNQVNGVFPVIKNSFSGVRPVENRVGSGKPGDLFYSDDPNADYSTIDLTSYIDDATNYITNYYKKQEANVPEYVEPLNEPMVHAVDFYPEGRLTPKKYITSKIDIIITKICELHRELGKKIHAAPEFAKK
ncbi:hypothetical protein FFWV33_14860 [Flavobacterium faecale]|uniref:Uncharacterized protein n=1 Tax=Flavobacterium faecale TaxID=1355330 RepID=A0A2S1LG30_9FLAO|nr:hypothetical protein [Flavobacterium faecale]AWG22714.1 hypothetical protein FFWV33_14860 [Flavobacterium faecale]